jgi:hypothetical protein
VGLGGEEGKGAVGASFPWTDSGIWWGREKGCYYGGNFGSTVGLAGERVVDEVGDILTHSSTIGLGGEESKP